MSGSDAWQNARRKRRAEAASDGGGAAPGALTGAALPPPEQVVTGTVKAVSEFVDQNPEQREAVLAAEKAKAKPRTTLIAALSDDG